MPRFLHEGEERVSKLTFRASSKLPRDQRYRLSGFCINYDEGEVHLLKSLLTKQLALLSTAEYEALKGLASSTVDFTYLEQNGLVELAERRFIVRENYDECKEYLFLLKVMRTMRKSSDGIKHYVILPTTACNARCTYCYEKDFVPTTMTDETFKATVDFIDRTRSSEKITLRWFGGEPLLTTSRIDQFCDEFTRRGISFKSNIVTNGSLLTPELAKRAWDQWNLRTAQVSLDGFRTDYELRKRFNTPSLHNYDTVMKGIHNLVDQGVLVALRCNYDEGNIEGLSDFVDDILREFAGTDRIRLYFALLFQDRSKEESVDLIHRICEVEDKVAQAGVYREDVLHTEPFKTNLCIADNMESCCVIDPEGNLQNCQHLDDSHIYGNVWEGITNQQRYDELKKEHEVDPCCQTCPFLPICTPFYRHGCLDAVLDYCRELRLAEQENLLHRIARHELADLLPED